MRKELLGEEGAVGMRKELLAVFVLRGDLGLTEQPPPPLLDGNKP